MKPAIKYRGKILDGEDSHSKILKKHKLSPNTGQRGFVEDDKFENRGQAAKIAKKPGVKKLHSRHLKG